MKNQYFGDINDYLKYGLLRVLQSCNDGDLLVAWMLTPDDGGRDGQIRSYLGAPGKWARHDPELFDGLKTLLSSSPAPSVSLIEGRNDLLPRASYYSAIVPDVRRERDVWRNELLRVASGVDLVFLDPDNGIEVESKPPGRKGSSKYVLWGEIQALWSGGASVLVYQHFRREPRGEFAKGLIHDLKAKTGAPLVKAFKTKNVLFLLAAQPRQVEQVECATEVLAQRWKGRIDPLD